jgi:hypothetical protein
MRYKVIRASIKVIPLTTDAFATAKTPEDISPIEIGSSAF